MQSSLTNFSGSHFCRLKRLSFFAIASLLLSSHNIQPADNPEADAVNDTISTYSISGVVVSATKIPTPLKEIGSTITVLTEADLKLSNKTFVLDALREVPGISIVQQGGPGRITRVFTRGANSNHTLILVDGVEVNDPGSPNNAADLSAWQTSDIERIEVLRGPQSTLYGSDALAGVINIITKKGSGKPGYYLSAEGGSYGTYKAGAGASGSYKMADYSIGYSSFHSDGFSVAPEKYGNKEKDQYRNNSLRARLGLNLSDNLNLEFISAYTRSKSALDQNDKMGDDPNFDIDLKEFTLKTAASLSLFDNRWTQSLAYSVYNNTNLAVDKVDNIRPLSWSDAYFGSGKWKVEWQNNFRLDEVNTLAFGLENETEHASTSYKGNDAMWGPSNNYFPSHRASTTGIYLQDQLNLLNTLYGSFGIRYDRHSRFGDALTFRLAPALFISSTGTKLKFTYGTGFKSPSLYYLFDPMYGNPELKAEKSAGMDAGIEQYLFNYRLTLSFSLFSTRFTNLIGYAPVTYKTVNIDKAETKGFEVSLSAEMIKNLSFKANYTYTDARNKSEGAQNGKLLIRRPFNKVSAALSYSDNRASASLEVTNTGKREDDDFSTFSRATLKAYTLLNMSASYRINNYIELTGRAENLLDEQYEEVLYYATAGRSFYGGIRLAL